MNHREVLGVNANASQKEIKKAFREAAKEYHPDLSNSPEAAKAFARIKEAHDALLKDDATSRESTTAQAASASASAATAQTAYSQPDPQTSMTADELAHIQELDEKARASAKRSFFRRSKESEEVKRHRKKIKTTERRLRGLY